MGIGPIDMSTARSKTPGHGQIRGNTPLYAGKQLLIQNVYPVHSRRAKDSYQSQGAPKNSATTAVVCFACLTHQSRFQELEYNGEQMERCG